jgi:hypothetical protein
MAHTLRNAGDDPLRGLIVISPGDAEHVFLPVEGSEEDDKTSRMTS